MKPDWIKEISERAEFINQRLVDTSPKGIQESLSVLIDDGYDTGFATLYANALKDIPRLLSALNKAYEALEEVKVAGSHAASHLIGKGIFPNEQSYNSVLEFYGSEAADIWVCWDKAMKASAALTAINQEGK